jgi:hypothetical protein
MLHNQISQNASTRILQQISVNPVSITRSLGLVAFLIVLSSIGTTAFRTWYEHEYRTIAFFYLDAEQNIPTFFSACLLLFAALLLAIVTTIERNRSSARGFHFAMLSCGLVLMAMDEIVSCHERLISPMSKLLGDRKLGIFYYAWVIPAIVIVSILLLFFWRFLLHLPAKTRRNFLMAGTIYFGGCIGFEMIGGYYVEIHGVQNLMYNAIATVEESLEMMGAIVLIWGLLVHIKDNYGEVRFQIDGVPSKVLSDPHLN